MLRLVAILLLAAVMLIATAVVTVISTQTGEGFEASFIVVLFAGLWLYWALGALIVIRANGHLVGWLFALAAAMMASVFACFALGFMLFTSRPGDPLGAWVGLAGGLLFVPAVILILPAVALTFPTGTLPSPRWRWAVRVLAALVAVRLLSVVLRPGPMFGDDGADADNPLTPWLPAFSPDVIEALFTLEAIGSLSLPLGAVLGVLAIVVRFRRSDGAERQQLKWFLAAIAPAAVLLPLSISGITGPLSIVDLLSVATLPLIAVAVAVAILRYRLYDIDRFISRSVSYGLVTALLISVLLLANLGLQTVLSSVTSGNSFAVAGSTLLAAALFTPVRKRVQRIVDRRFDRARYDGERTANAFSIRMRDATDLPTIRHDLDVTVQRSIAPSRIGLWLREGE